MSKAKTLAAAKFSVGTEVRVNSGVTLPELPDIPLGGWAGTVTEIFADQTPSTCVSQIGQHSLALIRWVGCAQKTQKQVYKVPESTVRVLARKYSGADRWTSQSAGDHSCGCRPSHSS